MYVKIESLCFAYEKHDDILNNVSLTMEEGEIVAVLGSSGSGKSTLLRLIGGLEMPGGGHVMIDEKTLCSTTVFVDAEKRGVGMVFQDYALFPHMTVEKNVAFGLNKLSRAERAKRVTQMLELTGLEDKRHRYSHELSGGQQQRVALARALAPNPSILLLDEPFSNLDTDLKYRIRTELRAIIKQTHMTSILVTHDYEDAKAIADRIVFLEEGRVVEESRIPHPKA